MANTVTLEVFTDYVCPWCYLGDNRLKKIRENYDIKVKLVHFPLHPETPFGVPCGRWEGVNLREG